MKKLTIFVLIVICLISMTSCDFISTLKGMSDSCRDVCDFWDAVKADEFDIACSLLHPNSEVLPSELENHLSMIEDELGINFTKDLYIIDVYSTLALNENFETSYFTQGYLAVDGKTYVFKFLTVDDEEGFGIYSFSVEPYTK